MNYICYNTFMLGAGLLAVTPHAHIQLAGCKTAISLHISTARYHGDIGYDFQKWKDIPYSTGLAWMSAYCYPSPVSGNNFGPFDTPMREEINFPVNESTRLFVPARQYHPSVGNNRLDGSAAYKSGFPEKNDRYLQLSVGLHAYQSKDNDTDGDGIANEIDVCPGTPAGMKVDRTGCPVDSDGDGVLNRYDVCPKTAAGMKVDRTGCPVDSDGDGIPNKIDVCPDTPSKVAVDRTGCPVDTDGDGVLNRDDVCPETAARMKVNADGCPVDTDEDGILNEYDVCPGLKGGAILQGCPDADNDGVTDSDDHCANTKIGVRVDLVGCPLDTDSDGVADYLDKCSGSPPRAKVDANGCPITKEAQKKTLPKQGVLPAKPASSSG